MELKIWQEGLNKIINNVIKLTEDADFLAQKESFGRAYFLYYTACEELTKAYYILDRFNKPDPKGLKQNLCYHDVKANLISGILFPPDAEDMSDLVNILKESDYKRGKFGSKSDLESNDFKLSEKIQERKDLLYWRDRGLYVDINTSNTDFDTPNDLTQKNVIELRDRLQLEIADVQARRDVYVKYNDKNLSLKSGKIDFREIHLNNQLINLLSFYEKLKTGSLHQIKSFKGVDSQIKDFFINILSKKDVDDKIFESIMDKTTNLVKKLFQYDKPKSDLEREIIKYYEDQIIIYMPTYFEQKKKEILNSAFNIGMDYLKNFIDVFVKKISKEPLDKEEQKEIEDFLANYLNSQLKNFFDGNLEKQKLIDNCKEQLEKDSNNVDLLKKIGKSYSELNDWQTAKEFFEKVRSINKNDCDTSLFLGDYEFSVNINFKKALKFYKKLLNSNPDNLDVIYRLGLCCESLRKFDKALRYYLQIVSAYFDLDEIWFRMSQVYLSQKKYSEAIIMLKITLKINPFNEEASAQLQNIVESEDLNKET